MRTRGRRVDEETSLLLLDVADEPFITPPSDPPTPPPLYPPRSSTNRTRSTPTSSRRAAPVTPHHRRMAMDEEIESWNAPSLSSSDDAAWPSAPPHTIQMVDDI